MSAIRIILVIFFGTVLQTILPKYFSAASYVDLALVLTVYLALRRETVSAMLTGAVAGLAQDFAFGSRLLGADGFTKTLTGYIISALSSRVRLDNPLVRMLVLEIASAVNSALFVMLHYFCAVVPEGMTPRVALIKGLWQMLANFLAGLVLFPLFDKVFREAPYDRSRAAELPRRKY